ncbi:MAG: hypothetical protein IJ520_00815 [Synergistaceae bacterium]|nr:hypothetical protein [Synergistaceae bacterium]
MPVHAFNDKLRYSIGEHERADCELLKKIIPGCVNVVKTDIDTDKTGIDYIATLIGGAKIGVDAKTREAGASLFWKHNEPELALETWSVRPSINNKSGKLGWTLSTASGVDLILFTFAPQDSQEIFLLPFHHLRTAFYLFGKGWQSRYGEKIQDSGGWKSSAVFVPASVVLDGIRDVMTGRMRIKNE